MRASEAQPLVSQAETDLLVLRSERVARADVSRLYPAGPAQADGSATDL